MLKQTSLSFLIKSLLNLAVKAAQFGFSKQVPQTAGSFSP